MAFMILPAILTAVFVGFLVYLFFWKKDRATFKSVLYPGLFFISLWVLLYYFVLR